VNCMADDRFFLAFLLKKCLPIRKEWMIGLSGRNPGRPIV
jgi:hypothetical protein